MRHGPLVGVVQRYPMRTSHRANLRPEMLEELARSSFGEASRDGDRVRARYGALEALTAGGEGKQLTVEVTMNPKVADDVARETIRRYNQFLEAVTGYNAKERAKRARKSASE